MKRKTRVGILFGGKSPEHEVSLQSARSIMDALDYDKYEVVMLGIDKKGQWYLGDSSNAILNADSPEHIGLRKAGDTVAVIPGQTHQSIIHLTQPEPMEQIDVVFPVLHGT